MIGISDEIMRNPLLALRAIFVGWATWFLFYYGIAPRLGGPFLRRFFLPSGFPFSAWMLVGFTMSLFVRADKHSALVAPLSGRE